MQTRQVAGGLGTVLAPQDFLDHLRRETGDANLFCWWEPGVSLMEPRPSSPEVKRGCWVVFQKQQRWTCTEVGHNPKPTVIHALEEVYVDVFKLDGAYGHSHDLGPWVADSMVRACISSRGYAERRREILAAKQTTMRDKVLRDHSESDYMARHLKDAFQHVLDHGPRPEVTLREEKIANMAELARKRDRRIKMAEHHGNAVSEV